MSNLETDTTLINCEAKTRLLEECETRIARKLAEQNPSATADQIEYSAGQLAPAIYDLWVMSEGYEISGRFGRYGLKFYEKIEAAEPWEYEDFAGC